MRCRSIFNFSGKNNVEFLLTHVTVVISISTSNELFKLTFTNDLSELMSNSSKIFDSDVACAFIIKESEDFADVSS